MKVTIIGPSLTRAGFLGRHALDIPKHGIKCTVAYYTNEYEDVHPIMKEHNFDAYNLKVNKGIPLNIITYKVLISVIKHADIVHLYHTAFPTSGIATIIAKLFKKPLVVTTTDHVVFKGLLYRLNSYIPWLLADKIISFSNWERDWLDSKGVTKEKITVIPLTVDFTRISRAYEINKIRKKEDNDYIEILFTGRKHPDKNLKILIRCVKILSKKTDKKFRLTLVGRIHDKKYFNEITNLIDELDLNQYVTLVDEVKDFEELVSYYAKSDVFIDIATFGTFELVVLEAMSCGLPIIVSKNVGASEIVDKEKCGFVVEPYDEKAIMKALKTLIEDDKLRIELGNISLNAVKNNYTWSHMIEKIKNVYMQLQ